MNETIDYAAHGSTFPTHRYRVRVNRGPLPPMAILEGMYSKGGVSMMYDGRFVWTMDRSRLDTNGVMVEEVVMVAKQFSFQEAYSMGGLSRESVIVWGSQSGLMAADEKETHAFGINLETCDLQLSRRLLGLGSSAKRQSQADQCVAMLGSKSGRRTLGHRWIIRGFHRQDWFLFVSS